MPTVPGPAPMRTRDGAPRRRRPGGHPADDDASPAIGGLPSLSAPLLTVESLLGPAPVGVCLSSAEGTDIALVRAARRLEPP